MFIELAILENQFYYVFGKVRVKVYDCFHHRIQNNDDKDILSKFIAHSLTGICTVIKIDNER